MKKYSLRYIFLFPFFFFLYSFASAIEVGGHLTENTVWSPDNNPYEVTETLYVDSDVTLIILPGTEIQINGAPCTNWDEQSQNFWLRNGVSIAKMFWVDGRIIAEGTQQDSILFTRLQNDNDYYWGCIYLSPQSELSSFQHCIFEYSAGIGIAVGNKAQAAISIYNGVGYISNCRFINNASNIITRYNLVKQIEITYNIFNFDNNIIDFVNNLWHPNLGVSKSEYGFKSALIAGNVITTNESYVYSGCSYYVNNVNNLTPVVIGTSDEVSYFYNNNFNNCERAIHGGIDHDDASAYIKNNHFIGQHDAIDLDYTYVEISDNTFEDCGVVTTYGSGKINNNYINQAEVISIGEYELFNNISSNGITGFGINQITSNINNLSINNEYAFGGYFNGIYNNCILVINNELTQYGVSGNPIFRNCILDFELPEECIDGGGNIWVDSLQAQEIFADIENGNFHLSEGSIAIDAGFDTTGYYYPFDMNYSHRIWDGDEDGNAIIDIGPYEFGSPSLGGIEGVTYNPETSESVDYVLLKINNEPGEFTFSDSTGNFNVKIPTGIYDIYAERLFYDDVIMYEVEVVDGEFTDISIPMFTTTEAEENGIIPTTNNFKLKNYPNPFKPSGAGRGPATTIEFLITEGNKISLSIYNIRGQLVKTLINSYLDRGKHQISWNGKNESGQSVSSGIYYCRLKSGNQETVRKMILIK